MLDPQRIFGERFDEMPVTPRIVQLFSYACCRLVWDLLAIPGLQAALEFGEQVADSPASDADWDLAVEAFCDDFDYSGEEWLEATALHAASLLRGLHINEHSSNGELRAHLTEILGAVERIATASGQDNEGWRSPAWTVKSIRAAQVALIDCLIPERSLLPPEVHFTRGFSDKIRSRMTFPVRHNSPPLPADWLTSTVTDLATLIYTDRAFDRMPVLSDALEVAGCDDRAMLTHCRNAHQHARGCWVLDRILGKN